VVVKMNPVDAYVCAVVDIVIANGLVPATFLTQSCKLSLNLTHMLIHSMQNCLLPARCKYIGKRHHSPGGSSIEGSCDVILD